MVTKNTSKKKPTLKPIDRLRQILGAPDEEGKWTVGLQKVEELIQAHLFDLDPIDALSHAGLAFVRAHPTVECILLNQVGEEATAVGIFALGVQTDQEALDRSLVKDFLIFSALFGHHFELRPNYLYVEIP